MNSAPKVSDILSPGSSQEQKTGEPIPAEEVKRTIAYAGVLHGSDRYLGLIKRFGHDAEEVWDFVTMAKIAIMHGMYPKCDGAKLAGFLKALYNRRAFPALRAAMEAAVPGYRLIVRSIVTNLEPTDDKKGLQEVTSCDRWNKRKAWMDPGLMKQACRTCPDAGTDGCKVPKDLAWIIALDIADYPGNPFEDVEVLPPGHVDEIFNRVTAALDTLIWYSSQPWENLYRRIHEVEHFTSRDEAGKVMAARLDAYIRFAQNLMEVRTTWHRKMNQQIKIKVDGTLQWRRSHAKAKRRKWKRRGATVVERSARRVNLQPRMTGAQKHYMQLAARQKQGYKREY